MGVLLRQYIEMAGDGDPSLSEVVDVLVWFEGVVDVMRALLKHMTPEQRECAGECIEVAILKLEKANGA